MSMSDMLYWEDEYLRTGSNLRDPEKEGWHISRALFIERYGREPNAEDYKYNIDRLRGELESVEKNAESLRSEIRNLGGEV